MNLSVLDNYPMEAGRVGSSGILSHWTVEERWHGSYIGSENQTPGVDNHPRHCYDECLEKAAALMARLPLAQLHAGRDVGLAGPHWLSEYLPLSRTQGKWGANSNEEGRAGE